MPAGRFKRYDPSNIIAVDELRFTPDGVEAGSTDAPVIDVHHRAHEHSRNRGDNGISIGFTGHYDIMQAKFGERITFGVAGENIIIDNPNRIMESELATGISIETAEGAALIDGIFVAAPCVEFSRYALDFPQDDRPDRTVTDTIAFLHEGVRGYYAGVTQSFTLRIGDRVFIRD
ncbi:MAG: MOSC domain-containing protein [Thermomicrobiales bacterium]